MGLHFVFFLFPFFFFFFFFSSFGGICLLYRRIPLLLSYDFTHYVLCHVMFMDF
ncbi:uncharacterized protein F4812DRAFT_428506 [Daldinia caldariorum]|uniref:uncharacterized protein n=1 Tax=Daldinia caldariorum TaxID=326644 RepID=UPI002008A5A1|nr:uncharacterized protein F4812DRAFT_428506 [Daldinia caldariorum]KAI1468017.1 hypothetical protein F4812DRAFT_428506 [Daldinia caldariorum]